MNICILGWYGSETMGDRAILDGIIKIFEAYSENNKYYLGSLIPFFTERTLYQDKVYYSENDNLNIEVFCEKDKNDLKDIIRKSDFVIMGGGPIMDILEIYIIRKAFIYAKKKGIKTGIIGCGFGPFHEGYFATVANDIIRLSDINIFRDEYSSKRAKSCSCETSIVTLSDPAVISALCYREKHNVKHEDYIAINYRDTRFTVYKDKIYDVMDNLYKLTSSIASAYKEVKMIPMHSFFWGGDDRSYFAEMFMDRRISNVNVIYEPQSLYELYDSYSAAKGCVGMRYHAVVLQTILNGNNIILDYSENNTGKISGFINELNSDFYNDRYSIIEAPELLASSDYISILNNNELFNYNKKSTDIINDYISEMF